MPVVFPRHIKQRTLLDSFLFLPSIIIIALPSFAITFKLNTQCHHPRSSRHSQTPQPRPPPAPRLPRPARPGAASNSLPSHTRERAPAGAGRFVSIARATRRKTIRRQTSRFISTRSRWASRPSLLVYPAASPLLFLVRNPSPLYDLTSRSLYRRADPSVAFPASEPDPQSQFKSSTSPNSY